MEIFNLLTHIFFIFCLGFYLITCLQWFSYKFERILLYFTKPLWHLQFFIIPVFIYFLCFLIDKVYFFIYFYLLYLPMFYFWYKKLDKKLIFTQRVKRFFIILLLSTLFIDFILFNVIKIKNLPVFFVLFTAFFISYAYEKYQFLLFKKEALKKLQNMQNLIIIQITASYGKTSIKNFMYQILSCNFKCYKTPRSVNTLAGLMKDVNENLPDDTQIYIAEAGARIKGDIEEITQFLKPHIVIVGEIGPQHIQYFKTLDNIRATKLEALNSPRLKQAFIHSSTNKTQNKNTVIYDEFLDGIKSTLEGIWFDISFDKKRYEFFAPVLGEFNASNIAVCVCVARFLDMDMDKIQNQVEKLKSVKHRLQKIEANGKLIIDDSFNGNINGMLASYELVNLYNGRKIIITPGIVESTKLDNEILAKKINDVFDLIIITGSLNSEILQNNINKEKTVILKDKSKLEQCLAQNTKQGDLILFSNDAPNFI